jgi:D-lactate dehydrogenase (cytochrome)
MNSPFSAPATDIQRPDAATIASVTLSLQQRFGNRVVTSQAVREQHGHTRTYTPNEAPDIVVWPQSTEEVAEIVKLCAEKRVPIIPFGTGTSLEGHVNAPYGGVSIDTSQMNQVIAVHAEDLDCVVGPGVTRKFLNETLRDQGLFFPIDPGADASIGGMVATRASGTNAVRYGTMKDNVLALTVVMPDGRIVKTGSRAKKSSAGYDLTRLFVGSEGTLGIITEITLKLYGIPEAISGGTCSFPTVKAACDAVIMTIQSGIPVARIELVDALQVKAINLYSKLDLPETPVLFLEFHGSAASVEEQAQRFGEIVEEVGGGPFVWTTKPEERTKLWQARHDAYWAAFTLRPGAQTVSTDICVPISRLAECVMETQEDIARTGIPAPIVGHVGDGNFHLLPLFFTDDAEEMQKLQGLLERLVKRGLAMEGTITGEHGVGQHKKKYMAEEHSEAALDLMRGIKRSFDPQNIMNPGKIF